ncbi:MspA family porin [Gordonia sp. (in: high G+C Gram-positive bacteria)]|uniref:MspA family porin n=1 Tax=Gordonia sp. (in: high G+C Gram-positive bacteria) TaxID=84139 RepID=UPI0039E60166
MNTRITKLVVAAGAAAVAASAILAPAAQADTRVVLPSQKDSQKMGDGTVISMFRWNERAIINQSVGGTPMHRNAAVSGQYRVTSSEALKKIQLRAGYVVGCQVNLGGLTTNGGHPNIGQQTTEFAPTAGTSLTVGPGQAVNYYIVETEKEDDYGNEKHEPKITWKKKKDVSFGYTNSQLTLNGCGGYAQARSIANVLIETKKATEYLVFYGRPFSLG